MLVTAHAGRTSRAIGCRHGCYCSCWRGPFFLTGLLSCHLKANSVSQVGRSLHKASSVSQVGGRLEHAYRHLAAEVKGKEDPSSYHGFVRDFRICKALCCNSSRCHSLRMGHPRSSRNKSRKSARGTAQWLRRELVPGEGWQKGLGIVICYGSLQPPETYCRLAGSGSIRTTWRAWPRCLGGIGQHDNIAGPSRPQENPTATLSVRQLRSKVQKEGVDVIREPQT